ncbi:hypothetical protein WG66_009601 [Moniliophthora roreri]|nr:hypothetical protein WG66_009601 [Moniliophthora roreri]
MDSQESRSREIGCARRIEVRNRPPLNSPVDYDSILSRPRKTTMASSKPQSGFNTVKTECYAPSCSLSQESCYAPSCPKRQALASDASTGCYVPTRDKSEEPGSAATRPKQKEPNNI